MLGLHIIVIYYFSLSTSINYDSVRESVGEAIDASDDADTVENADLISRDTSPFRGLPNMFSNYVTANTAHAALEKAVLQKITSADTFVVTGMRFTDSGYLE